MESVKTERKQRVLLVEDNDGDEMLALRALRRHGAETTVFIARDGEQAIQVIRSLGRRFDDYPSLILLDLSLPKVSGFEVLSLVKSTPALASIPVAVVTGSLDPETEAACLRLGANAFLSKPMDCGLYYETLRPIFIQTLGPSSGPAESIANAVTLA